MSATTFRLCVLQYGKCIQLSSVGSFVEQGNQFVNSPGLIMWSIQLLRQAKDESDKNTDSYGNQEEDVDIELQKLCGI